MADYYLQTVVHQTIPVAFLCPLEEWLLKRIFDWELDKTGPHGDALYLFAEESPRDVVDIDDVSEFAKALGASAEIAPELTAAVAKQFDADKDSIDTTEIGEWSGILQGVIKRHPAELPYVAAEVSFTCSKMRADGFGGAAILITADLQDGWATAEWIHHRLLQLGLEKPAPAIGTYPNGAPMYAADGTMLDDQGNRSIFDDVDQ
jgi:hypothetical protein